MPRDQSLRTGRRPAEINRTWSAAAPGHAILGNPDGRGRGRDLIFASSNWGRRRSADLCLDNFYRGHGRRGSADLRLNNFDRGPGRRCLDLILADLDRGRPRAGFRPFADPNGGGRGAGDRSFDSLRRRSRCGSGYDH